MIEMAWQHFCSMCSILMTGHIPKKLPWMKGGSSLDMNTRPRKVSVDIYIDLKFAVSGDPNLECIRQYQYQSSLSISLYLNINYTGMNPSPTGIGYLWVSVQSQSQCESESQSLSESQSRVDRVIFSLSPVSVSVWSQSQSQSQYTHGLDIWWISVSVMISM